MHCALGLGESETALRVTTVLTMMFCHHRTTEVRALWAAAEGLLDAPDSACAVPPPVRAWAALACGASNAVYNGPGSWRRVRSKATPAGERPI
jgi:hypothetical protein